MQNFAQSVIMGSYSLHACWKGGGVREGRKSNVIAMMRRFTAVSQESDKDAWAWGAWLVGSVG